MNPILARIDNKPWAILPSFLDSMRATFAKHEPQAHREMAPKAAASSVEQAGYLKYGFIGSDGVATINVTGVLYNPEGYIDELIEFYFGGTSIPDLIRDIDAVLNDSSVKSVVFNFHSPGGEVFGINEAADKIADLTAKKPTTAYCYGLCASAAYFLAAKCGQIVTDAQAMLGSIGVVCVWYDLTGAYEQMGVAYEEVTSENAPYKRLDIRKPEERQVFMDEINGIETIFLKSVAKGRGVPLDTVKSDFGKGAIMAGWQAVKAGLADRTGSLDEVVKELSRNKAKAATASASAEGDIDMGFKEEFKKFAAAMGFKAEEKDPGEGAEEERDPTESGDAGEAQEAPPVTDEAVSAEGAAAAAAAPAIKIPVDAEAALAATRTELVETQANAFIESEVKAGRMLPAEKDSFKSVFVQAASDDNASPLESGSRVESLKATQASRKPHGLTDEVIDAKANQVLLAATGDRTDEQKKADLLSKSALGQAALKLVTGGKSATAAAKN